MQSSRLWFQAAVLSSAAIVALAACTPAPTGSSTPNQPAAPPPPQELRVGTPYSQQALDPHLNAGSNGGIKYSVFDTLMRVDDKGNVGPWLATAWKSVDPTTWELTLRTDVKFSNGEPMDAAAVKFSIERLIDPANKLALSTRIPSVNGASVVSPNVVRITTSRVDAILPARLSAIFVVPPKEVAAVGAQAFGQKPVGTGAFKVLEFVPDQRLVVEKFSESWRKTNLTKLSFIFLTDSATRQAALRTGEIDILGTPLLDQLPVLEREGFITSAVPFARVHVADFDVITEDSPLRNKLVRQALNYAVDKEAILKSVYGARGRVADSQLVGPIGFGYDNTMKPYPYDVAKAKALLAEAGYPNGFTIKMDSPSSGFLNSREQAIAVQGFFREVGVTAELDLLEQGVFLDRFYARNGQKRNPIFFWAPNYFPAMDADFTQQWYITGSQKKVFSNAQYDQLYTASTVELDSAKRLALIKQMSVIMRDEAAVLFLIEPADYYSISKKVKGFVPRSDGELTYDGITITN